MEFLMSIFFILILLFLGFVIFWWIGLFVPDDKDMEVLKKDCLYDIWNLSFYFISPITFTNIAILLCICIIVILIMKYIAPMLYVKTILFIKKYRKNISCDSLLLISRCLDRLLSKWKDTIITNLEDMNGNFNANTFYPCFVIGSCGSVFHHQMAVL